MRHIETDDFVNAMEDHWVHTLGNVSSDALRHVWDQLGYVFTQNITSHDSLTERKRWHVVSPPTGSGKTQGAILYSAMLANGEPEEHPGVLFVTRFIQAANGIAKQINELAHAKFGAEQYGTYAVAYHSESTESIEKLREYPVLVITHRAYELALDKIGYGAENADVRQTFHFFHNWGIDTRRLVIVDEALDLVEDAHVNLDELNHTFGSIPWSIQERHPNEMRLLEGVIGIFKELVRLGGNDPERVILTQPAYDKCVELQEHKDEVKAVLDLTALRKAMRSQVKYHWKDPVEDARLRELHDERLRNLEWVLNSWLYYSKFNSKHTLHTARLLVPDEVKGAVIMDATAKTNVAYELFEHANVLTPPPDARTYRNVNLHVSRGHKTGKDFMTANAKELCEALYSDLNERIAGRSALIVTHKDVEPVLVAHSADAFNLSHTHWGNVDGSNEWRDCDVCVVFGMPFLPSHWSANVFFAYRGPQNTGWLNEPERRAFNGHADIRAALHRGQMATDLVQAVNRIRCRKVVDAEGNCPSADVYLMLPNGELGEQLLAELVSAMPGVNVLEDWEFDEAGKTKVKRTRARQSRVADAVLLYLKGMKSGERITKKSLAKELGVSVRQVERAVETEGFADKLREINVSTELRRNGRTQSLNFVRE